MRITHLPPGNQARILLGEILAQINKVFDHNIRFYEPPRPLNRKQTSWSLRLYTHTAHGLGARLGMPVFKGLCEPQDYEHRRHMRSACWHVHGVFFDLLLLANPNAVIYTGRVLEGTNRIDQYGGNWKDMNIGSAHFPYDFSDACACGDNKKLMAKILFEVW